MRTIFLTIMISSFIAVNSYGQLSAISMKHDIVAGKTQNKIAGNGNFWAYNVTFSPVFTLPLGNISAGLKLAWGASKLENYYKSVTVRDDTMKHSLNTGFALNFQYILLNKKLSPYVSVDLFRKSTGLSAEGLFSNSYEFGLKFWPDYWANISLGYRLIKVSEENIPNTYVNAFVFSMTSLRWTKPDKKIKID